MKSYAPYVTNAIQAQLPFLRSDHQNAQKKKILLLFEYGTLNGGENSISAILSILRQEPTDWVAMCPPGGGLAKRLASFSIPQIPYPQFSGPTRLRDARAFLAHQIDAIRPTLVHANSLSMARMAGPVCQASHLPSLGHLRDIVRLSKRAIRDLNQNRQLIAVSHAVRDFHIQQGMDGDRILVIYNGIDPVEFSPGPPTGYLHAELQIPRDALILGGIGQLGMRKGWDLLLDSLRSVFDKHPNVHCVLVGERNSTKPEAFVYVERLRALAGAGLLKHRVHFLGRRTDVPRLLREVSILVHPARQEPLGRVLLEAAATGLPIVATEVGGTGEIFPKNSDAAILVASGDSAQMAVEIQELVACDAIRKRLGDKARCHVVANFPRGRCAKATWCVYEHLSSPNDGGNSTID